MTDSSNDDINKGPEKQHLLEMTSEIISSYVANNPVSNSELLEIIDDVYSAISKIASTEALVGEHGERHIPAVPVKHSLNDDYLICLEDGKQFKSLKRHLNSQFGMSPDEYRRKWGLPSDYPMVAPNYAKARSRLAKEIGLGKRVVPKND
ncbi:MAG: MucR family transcriptional regulator [Pseudomonadota bacterium]